MTSVLAAVILAAGASTRMGAAKPLLAWRGRSFVGHVIDQARAAGCAPIVVVEGAWPLPDAELVHAVRCRHPGWADGPITSLVAGLRQLGAPRSVVVATIDRPHVSPSTWTALAEASRSEPDAVWQPAWHGRRGHPIVLPQWLVADLGRFVAAASLRDVLAAPDLAATRRTVAVDDPAVLDNIDDPAAVARLPA